MSWGDHGRPSEALRTSIEEQAQRFPVLPILQAGLHRIVPRLPVLRALPFLHHMPSLTASTLQQGVLGDEKHVVLECSALQDLRDRYENLFQVPQADAMIPFMWQDDIIGVAVITDACLQRVYT